MHNSPYGVLGIAEGAHIDDAERAYRRLAKKHHPDMDGGDEKLFASVLTAIQAIRSGRPYASEPTPRPREAPLRKDRTRVLRIPVTRAWTGGRIRLDAVPGPCEPCRGTGTIPSGREVSCAGCGGTGVSASGERGIIRVSMTCPTCEGTGRVTVVPCEACGGAGTSTAVSARIVIPAGCRDGETFVVVGGANDPGANTVGDLHVRVTVVPASGFEAHGKDVRYRHVASIWDVALGHRQEVALPDGRTALLDIAPGTGSGTIHTLSGYGMPGRGEADGDLVVRLEVRAPDCSAGELRKVAEAGRRLDLSR